jgi:hypothetical protein
MEEIVLREVKWHPKTNRIAQIPKEGLEFAMLSAKYEQLNQLVWCKDFMQDVIWAHVNQKPIEIYGFKYNPEESPAPSIRRLRLLVTNYKDHEFGKRLQENVLPLLHSVEDRMKMSRTVLEKSKKCPPIYKKSGVWILDGSKRWLKSAPMLSFYTLLIRVGLVHDPADSLEVTLNKIKDGKLKSYYDDKNRDKKMISDAIQGINKILIYSDRKIFNSSLDKNYKETCKVYTMHENCGIVGFSKEKTKCIFPEWHKV